MSNDIRYLLGLMRGTKKPVTSVNSSKSNEEMNVREMLSKMRQAKRAYINEAEISQSTPFDQKNEEKKTIDFFDDDNLVFDFEELKIYDNGVWWGGTINNVIEWVFKVSTDEKLNGLDINEMKGVDANVEKNQEIIKKLEAHYETFSNYWIDNKIQK
jgi:hypothetical protein